MTDGATKKLERKDRVACGQFGLDRRDGSRELQLPVRDRGVGDQDTRPGRGEIGPVKEFSRTVATAEVGMRRQGPNSQPGIPDLPGEPQATLFREGRFVKGHVAFDDDGLDRFRPGAGQKFKPLVERLPIQNDGRDGDGRSPGHGDVSGPEGSEREGGATPVGRYTNWPCNIAQRTRPGIRLTPGSGEKGRTGRSAAVLGARLAEVGIGAVNAAAGLNGAKVVVFALDDNEIGKVAADIAPQLAPGTTLLILDAAAPYADALPKDRPDLTYFVGHRCHAPLYNDETDRAARRDYHG